MIKKKTNVTIKILILLLSLIINIEPCLAAAEISIATSGERADGIVTKDGSYKHGSKTYTFKYKESLIINKTISMDAIDLNGESLVDNNMFINKKFKAGTWIGGNVTEHQVSVYTLYKSKSDGSFVSFKEKVWKYTCEYNITEAGYCNVNLTRPTREQCQYFCPYNTWCEETGLRVCHCSCQINSVTHGAHCSSIDGGTVEYSWTIPYVDDNEEDGVDATAEPADCPSYYTNESGVRYDNAYHKSVLLNEDGEAEVAIDTIEVNVSETVRQGAIESVIAGSQNRAKNALGGGALAEVKYIKYSNDYKAFEECQESGSDDCYGYLRGTSRRGAYDIEVPYTIPDTYQNAAAIDYEFLPPNVCMDAQTSYVTYREGNCQPGELLVKTVEVNGRTYWKYFIPLNAKSDSEFWVKIGNRTDSKLKKEECKYIIDNIPTEYKKFISPLDSTKEYIGDYRERVSRDKELLENENGCKVAVTINFPITQQFYNEVSEDGELIFKGFNFFYKPININEPFPNGINGNSLWKEWYDNYNNGNRVNPDLSDSFSEVTYKANIYNPSVIRNYNKNNLYSDWSNIDLDGRSSFIGDGMESLGIITRENIYQIYKLACGKANSDPSNSILYQDECGDNS